MINSGLLINPYRFTSVFSPSDISNLYGWYDASDLATITKDGSNRVSQWNDKSGNARHLVQATGGNQPLWVDDGKNSLDIIRTDGSRWMNVNWTDLAQPLTVCFACELPNTNSRTVLGGASFVYIFHKSGNANEWRVNAGTELNFTDAGLLGSSVYGTLLANGASSDIRINGSSKTTGAIGANSLTVLSVSVDDGGTQYADVDYYEIIVYSKILNSTEYGQVESYLASKWAI